MVLERNENRALILPVSLSARMIWNMIGGQIYIRQLKVEMLNYFSNNRYQFEATKLDVNYCLYQMLTEQIVV